jgi:uncharacterized membrane protein
MFCDVSAKDAQEFLKEEVAMSYIRRFGGQLALLALSIIGIGISIYLTAVHYSNAPLICSASGVVNCERVITSIYSYVPLTTIPVSVAGLLWFVVFGVLSLSAWRMQEQPIGRTLVIGEVAWAAVGLLTVFYLLYVEFVRLHAICIWCTSLHVIILIMLLLSVVLLQQRPYEDEEWVDEDEEAVTGVTAR